MMIRKTVASAGEDVSGGSSSDDATVNVSRKSVISAARTPREADASTTSAASVASGVSSEPKAANVSEPSADVNPADSAADVVDFVGANPNDAAVTLDAELEPNEAVEIVEGQPEMVEVSKHPEASIPQTDLSLADIQRRRSHPVWWAVYLSALLVAIVAPYWFGRNLAVNRTAHVVKVLGMFAPRGLAFVAWTVTVVAVATVALSIVEEHAWFWRILFLFVLAADQLISGACLLKTNFWYSTYVVYGTHSGLPNAVDLGIIAALFAVAAYALLFVGLLIGIKKTSPLNVLTRSWAALLMFFVIEVVALIIVLFGGLLAAV